MAGWGFIELLFIFGIGISNGTELDPTVDVSRMMSSNVLMKVSHVADRRLDASSIFWKNDSKS